MKLSVVIVNYNVQHFLRQCLISVQKAIPATDALYGPGSVEVFVVDNNSSDDSVSMVRELFPNVKLIANKDNPGFSKANNQAIRLSNAEYVLLLNPDTVVAENTFSSICMFMDQHPDAGGLGTYMIDGKGRFLPESKRGLPTPSVAFYKIFGLSALFKKSRIFGKYHLSYLPKDETHTVDVLSGAFMFMRKKTLDEAGLLDETFFMYGEDIDLSYRISLSGYKNYYFPDAPIIHYKGESTKKGSVNYVFVFYKAMIIFAQKHFSKQHAGFFSALIHLAIYLRASLSILSRLLKSAALPLFDFIGLYASMWMLKSYWENNHKYIEGGYYPDEYTLIVIPVYIVLWISGLFFYGAYEKKHGFSSVWKGITAGTVLILILYALINDEYRFSRALILLGSICAIPVVYSIRSFAHFIRFGTFNIERDTPRRAVIVSDAAEFDRIRNIIYRSNAEPNILGFISPDGFIDNSLGEFKDIEYLIRMYQVEELIFSSQNMSNQEIIDSMIRLNTEDSLDYKIAPPDCPFIIGSNSINTQGELYTSDLKRILTDSNKRKKRNLDVLISLSVLIFYIPLSIITAKPIGLFVNATDVLRRKKSWVGYAGSPQSGLPKILPGVLYPGINFQKSSSVSRYDNALNRLYAANYSVKGDLQIVFRGIRYLGNIR